MLQAKCYYQLYCMLCHTKQFVLYWALRTYRSGCCKRRYCYQLWCMLCHTKQFILYWALRMIAADVANAGNAIIFGACSATPNSLVSIELCERIAAEVIMKKAAYNNRFGKMRADVKCSSTFSSLFWLLFRLTNYYQQKNISWTFKQQSATVSRADRALLSALRQAVPLYVTLNSILLKLNITWLCQTTPRYF